MLIWLVFGLWRGYPDYWIIGGNVMEFVLFLLLGWKNFGPPVQG